MLVYFAHPAFTSRQERVKMEFLERLSRSLAGLERGRHITIIDPFVYAPIVEADVAPALLERLERRARGLRLGNGLEPGTDVGPLINAAQKQRVEGFIRQARDSGIPVLAQGQVAHK